jgi:hypothetical protein
MGRRRLLKDRSHKIIPFIRILDAREEPLIFQLGSEQLKLYPKALKLVFPHVWPA